MLGIGAGIIPFTTNNSGGGGTGAVDSVVVHVGSPDGTVNQPSPSSCQVVDGVAIVDVQLTSQQGQQNAVKKITTPTGVLLPDQVSGNVNMDAATVDAYTQAQTDEAIAPVAQDAADAKTLANQSKQESANALTVAQGANTKSNQALAKVDEIVINLNAIQGSIVSDSISGTLVFSYANKTIVLTEEIVMAQLPFVKSVAGALPDAQGDAKPTPAQLNTYSQQQIDDEFASQEQEITTNAENIEALTLKYNNQTGEITSPDGTVVGAMNFNNQTGKWTLSLRATGSGASTIIDSDTLDITAITGGYKIDLDINPAQLEFIDKILNVISSGAEFTPDGTTIVANSEKVMSIAPTILAEIDEALMTAQQIDEELISHDTVAKSDSAVQIVNTKTGNSITLTAADVDAYNKAYINGQFALVEAEAAGLQTQITNNLNNMKKINITTTVDGQNPINTVISSSTWGIAVNIPSGAGSIKTNSSLQNEIIATPKNTYYSSTNYNYGQNWTANFKYVNGLCKIPQVYITRLNVAGASALSGGTYGAFTSYSSSAFNQIISKPDLDYATIYAGLNANSSLTFNFVGTGQGDGCAIPKSLFSSGGNMTQFAAILETRIKTVTNPLLENATVVWDGTYLKLESGDLNWQFDLCKNWDGDNANNLLGLTPQSGANLLPAGFSGLLETITFDVHDNIANPARMSKPYTPQGNTNQFVIEIYENGYFLPPIGDYALLTYDLTTTDNLGVNQNDSYDNLPIKEWANDLSKINIDYAAEVRSVIIVLSVQNKKPSPYKNIYFTAIGLATGNVNNNTMILAASRDYGLSNPIGQPIRVSQGGGNGIYEDEYIKVEFGWRFPLNPNPYNIYAGNAPAVTITNNPVLTSQSKIQYQTFINTGLVDRDFGNIIKSKLEAQIYDNNFFVSPSKINLFKLSNSLITSGGTFNVYFLFNKVNYTQTFTSQVMIPLEGTGSFTNCVIRIMLPASKLFNGKVSTNNYIDLLKAASTLNSGQFLILNFAVTFINGDMNINCELGVQPITLTNITSSANNEITQGQSNLINGRSSMIIGDILSSPKHKITGVSLNRKTKIYSLQGGRIYKIVVGGTLYFNAPFLHDNIDNPNPLLVGLINIDDLSEDYTIPVICGADYSDIHDINPDNTIITLDLSDRTGVIKFKKCMIVDYPEQSTAILHDHLSIDFIDDYDEE